MLLLWYCCIHECIGCWLVHLVIVLSIYWTFTGTENNRSSMDWIQCISGCCCCQYIYIISHCELLSEFFWIKDFEAILIPMTRMYVSCNICLETCTCHQDIRFNSCLYMKRSNLVTFCLHNVEAQKFCANTLSCIWPSSFSWNISFFNIEVIHDLKASYSSEHNFCHLHILQSHLMIPLVHHPHHTFQKLTTTFFFCDLGYWFSWWRVSVNDNKLQAVQNVGFSEINNLNFFSKYHQHSELS